MIAMQGSDLRGEDFQSSSPPSILVHIVDNIVVWPVDYLKGQSTQH